MQIYNYDSNGLYTSTHTLDDSDRDPLNQDKYLIPANSTTIVPPTITLNQATVWVDNEWQIKLDYRGQKYWLDDVEHVMTELGDYPHGAKFEKPVTVLVAELESAKEKARSTIKNAHATNLIKLTGNATEVERQTWSTKLAAAQAVLEGVATIPQLLMLATEAQSYGITEQALANKIIYKSNTYHKMVGLASAIKNTAEQAIERASTTEEIDAALLAASQQVEQAIAQLASTSA